MSTTNSKENRVAQSQQDGTERRRSAPPLPKRSKGKLFIGAIFVSVVGMFAYSIWASFLQNQAYGVINGRVITVSAPWDGVVVNWRVRDGDSVEQGDIVVQLTNLEMEHRLQSIQDDLKFHQAELVSLEAKIRLESLDAQIANRESEAMYLRSAGELAQESSKLDELQIRVDRGRQLMKSNTLSKQKFERVYYEFVGQKRKLEKLTAALAVLKLRSTELNIVAKIDSRPKLGPLVAKIDSIKSEIIRLREMIDNGKLKAPVSGRITKRHTLTGESIQKNESLIEILEAGSTEAVLYMPQKMVKELKAGHRAQVTLEPYTHMVECEVMRFGECFEAPPENISRFYRSDQYLLPVYLRPMPEYEQQVAFRIDGTIKLPFRWRDRTLEWWSESFASVREWWSTGSTADRLNSQQGFQQSQTNHLTDPQSSHRPKPTPKPTCFAPFDSFGDDDPIIVSLAHDKDTSI